MSFNILSNENGLGSFSAGELNAMLWDGAKVVEVEDELTKVLAEGSKEVLEFAIGLRTVEAPKEKGFLNASFTCDMGSMLGVLTTSSDIFVVKICVGVLWNISSGFCCENNGIAATAVVSACDWFLKVKFGVKVSELCSCGIP